MTISLFSLLSLLFACSSNPLELGLTEEAGARNIMHYFSSNDLKNWKHEGPISWGITSLGLHEENGFLAITSIQEVRPPTWWEQQYPKVYGYLFDGMNFKASSWSIDDKESNRYIDPQSFEGHMWYISPTGYTGDPAKAPKTPIRTESPGRSVYSDARIADPSPVRFNEALHVFASKNGAIIHLVEEGDALREIHHTPESNRHFNGVTVPFATVINGTLWLLAQRQINNRRLPVYSTSEDGIRWSKWQQLANIPLHIQACSSPVLGANPMGGWAMFCIEEKGMPQGNSSHPSPNIHP